MSFDADKIKQRMTSEKIPDDLITAIIPIMQKRSWDFDQACDQAGKAENLQMMCAKDFAAVCDALERADWNVERAADILLS
eukprot:m.478198 g.478198  ORF g.478198 m.478198 type:complete len:81 (+) comp21070_c0_seq1:111-353(+)